MCVPRLVPMHTQSLSSLVKPSCTRARRDSRAMFKFGVDSNSKSGSIQRAKAVRPRPLPSTIPPVAERGWYLSAICVCDGSNGTDGRNTLLSGVFYSTQAWGRNEQLHPEAWSWLALESVGIEEISIPTYWLDVRKRGTKSAPKFIIPSVCVR